MSLACSKRHSAKRPSAQALADAFHMDTDQEKEVGTRQEPFWWLSFRRLTETEPGFQVGNVGSVMNQMLSMVFWFFFFLYFRFYFIFLNI